MLAFMRVEICRYTIHKATMYVCICTSEESLSKEPSEVSHSVGPRAITESRDISKVNIRLDAATNPCQPPPVGNFTSQLRPQKQITRRITPIASRPTLFRAS